MGGGVECNTAFSFLRVLPSFLPSLLRPSVSLPISIPSFLPSYLLPSLLLPAKLLLNPPRQSQTWPRKNGRTDGRTSPWRGEQRTDVTDGLEGGGEGALPQLTRETIQCDRERNF